MKKAIYLPTKQNTVIINELVDYVEILLEGEFKKIPKSDIDFIVHSEKISSLEELKENIYLNCIKEPLSDILYSFNSNRLIPEPHQYKPLIKFMDSENNRVLIADEVGLGKTIEAGMIFKEIDSREDLRISLIVVPSSLTIKWQEEFNIRFDEYFEIKKTNQANIGVTALYNILIPLPTLSEQKRIVAKLDELMSYCDSLEESITNSQTQNEMLLGQVLREALEPKEKEVVQ